MRTPKPNVATLGRDASEVKTATLLNPRLPRLAAPPAARNKQLEGNPAIPFCLKEANTIAQLAT